MSLCLADQAARNVQENIELEYARAKERVQLLINAVRSHVQEKKDFPLEILCSDLDTEFVISQFDAFLKHESNERNMFIAAAGADGYRIGLVMKENEHV